MRPQPDKNRVRVREPMITWKFVFKNALHVLYTLSCI